MTTGEKIREQRKKLGMTQEELGAKIGVQKAAINKYETGLVVNLKRTTILKLSHALCVPVTALLDEDGADDLSMEEKNLITLYRGADDRAQRDAVRILEENQKQDTASEQMA